MCVFNKKYFTNSYAARIGKNKEFEEKSKDVSIQGSGQWKH